MAALTFFDQVQRIYIAYYNRPADPAGLLFWAQRSDAAGGNLQQVINAFANSAEAQGLYGVIDATTIGAVIDAIYQALFGRAPDAGGRAFYVEGFARGQFTAGTIALSVLEGATGTDLTILQNRLGVANLFTRTVDGNAPESAAFGVGPRFAVTYDGGDIAAARNLLAGIREGAATVPSAADVLQFIRSTIANPGDPILGAAADTTPPTLALASVDGRSLSLNFNEALQTANLPGASSFTLTVNGVALASSAYTLTGVSGSALQITLGTALSATDVLQVSYRDPSAGNDPVALQDVAGNDVASFSDVAVLNRTAAPPQPFALNDPLLGAQWYLKNTGQRYAAGETRPAVLLDLNVEAAWRAGFTGQGIRIGVTDDGIDLNHVDLQANLLKDLTFNGVNGATGANAYQAGNGYTPDREANAHGTVVGSVAAAAGNNGQGIVGVAYGAKIVSALGVAAGADIGAVFRHLADVARVDVSINSFGLDPAFSENYYIAPGTPTAQLSAKQQEFLAIQHAATTGRGGKGMVIEVSAGNERSNGADAAMTGFTSSRYIITSGAVTELGNKTSYTTPGASVLVSAFGGENPGGLDASVNAGFAIASADVNGAAGYNTRSGSEGDYAFQNTGTSYSGPMVGATAALMLQANPNLGFRDVSTILAMTARGVGTENNYLTNRATNWNLGGMHFSRDVGFGLIDVAAAVQLAESWVPAAGTAANWLSAEGQAASGVLAIPDNNANGLAVTATLTQNILIERMEFELKLNASSPSQLRAEVTSPNGTTLVLFDRPLAKDKDRANDASVPDTAWPGVFQIGATGFLGETSAGTWTLRLIDTVTGAVASYESLTVRAWGSALTDDSQIVFTQEFSGSRTLSDSAGTDTLQAAALHTGVVLNLNAGSTSTVAAGSFTLAAGTVIENAIGGAGNDLLVGNGLDNLLRGNGGADTLVGGAGSDRLAGGQGVDTFRFVRGEDGSPGVGRFDILADYRLGGDSVLDFANALVLGGQGRAAGAGVATVSGTGVLSFNAADASFSQRLTAAEAALQGLGAERVVIWQEGADAFLFVSDASSGVGAGDSLVQLVGVSVGAGGLILAGGDVVGIG